MFARISRITPVTLVLALFVALVAAQIGAPRLASQDLATPIGDSTETPPSSGAGIESSDEVSTLAINVTVSHAFSNDTPSPGETIDVTVTISGNSTTTELHLIRETITAATAPFVTGEPQITNQQNIVPGSTSYVQREEDGFSGRYATAAPGDFALTVTYPVTIDPAASGTMEFTANVTYEDGTSVASDTATVTITSEPTATTASDLTVTVSHDFSNDTPSPGETVNVSVTFSGSSSVEEIHNIRESITAATAPFVTGEPQVSNEENIFDRQLLREEDGFSGFYQTRGPGTFAITVTYQVTIDPAASGTMEFTATAELLDGTPVASDTDTLTLTSNTPEPTVTGTVPPPTNTPDATATSTSVPETNTPEPTEEPRGSAVITLETSDGEDIPGATTLCVGDSCITVGEIASQAPVSVPSGSTFTFDDLPIGELAVTATDASPYRDAASSVTTTAGEPATLTLVLQLDEPDPTETEPPQPTEGTDSPVTTLPETGHGQAGSSASWTLLAAAALLLASAGLIVQRSRVTLRR